MEWTGKKLAEMYRNRTYLRQS